MLAFGVSCLHFDHGSPLPRGSRRFQSRRSLNVPVRCLLALFLPFRLFFFLILQGGGKTPAKFRSMVEDSFLSFSPSFFFKHKSLSRFLPSAVSSHYPPTLLPHLLHHSLLLAAAAAAASLTPLPSFARSQERRYLLCPLCRSLARCQMGTMPIKSHE